MSGGGDPPGPDQRADLRAACELPVELQFTTGLAGSFTANLSTSGMFVRHVAPQPVGTLVRFTLDTRGGKAIAGMGEVKWIRVRHEGPGRPAGSGIRFRHLASDDRERLRVLIHDAMGSELPPSEHAPRPADEKPPLPASLAVDPAEIEAEEAEEAARQRRERPPAGRGGGRRAATGREAKTGRSATSGRSAEAGRAEKSGREPIALPGPLGKLKPREQILGGLLVVAFLAWLIFG